MNKKISNNQNTLWYLTQWQAAKERQRARSTVSIILKSVVRCKYHLRTLCAYRAYVFVWRKHVYLCVSMVLSNFSFQFHHIIAHRLCILIEIEHFVYAMNLHTHIWVATYVRLCAARLFGLPLPSFSCAMPSHNRYCHCHCVMFTHKSLRTRVNVSWEFPPKELKPKDRWLRREMLYFIVSFPLNRFGCFNLVWEPNIDSSWHFFSLV